MNDGFDGSFSTRYRFGNAQVRFFADIGIHRQLKTGFILLALILDMVFAQSLHIVMGRIHVRIGQDKDLDLLACLNVGEYRALFVE